MRRSRFCLFFPVLVLLCLPVYLSAQSWSGIISPSRATDWTQAGIPGGLPDLAWKQCGPTIAPYSGTADTINNALAASGAGYTGCTPPYYISLGAGAFTLSTGIHFPFNTIGHVALRGQGANSTFLNFGGAASGCNAGVSALVCMQSSDSSAPGNTGLTTYNWTAGYAQGATQITLSSVAGITLNQTLLFLNQCDTGFSGSACTTGSATDNGNYFVCSAQYNNSNNTGCGVSGPDGTTWRANAWQMEIVTVTAINPGGCGATCVTISPPLQHPNWASGQNPQAVVVQPVVEDGIENLAIDGSGTGSAVSAGMTLFNAYQCWVSGVKLTNIYEFGFYALDVSHTLIQNNYLYHANGHPDPYAIRISWGGDDLVQNNIIEQWKNSFANDGPASGEVIAYNFSVNQLVPSPSDFMWAAYWTHSTGDDFMLREGNIGDQAQDDNVHGSHLNLTNFRNFFMGWESCANGNCGGLVKGGNGSATSALVQSSNVRYSHNIGNVLGTPGFTTIYQTTTPFSGLSAYTIGAGNANYSLPADPLVPSTMLLWGNYDVVTGKVRWCGNSSDTGWLTTCLGASEVPTTAPLYPNGVPTVGDTAAGQAPLPPSFYLPAKPSWFGSLPWPAIGPDVSGGNVGQCTGLLNTLGEYAGLPATNSSQCTGTSLASAWGGHVNTNPAMNCYLNAMGGAPDGTGGVLPFDSTTCYGISSSSLVSPPTSLSAVVR